MWFQNRRAKLRRQLKIQNKSSKADNSKCDDTASSEDNSSGDGKKETSRSNTPNSRNNDRNTSHPDEYPKVDKDNDEKKKRKKRKKSSSEQHKTDFLNQQNSKTSRKPETNDPGSKYFVGQKTSASDKNYDQLSQDPNVFVENNSIVSTYSSWIASPEKSSLIDQLNPNAESATEASSSLSSMSPNSVKSHSWGNELASSQRPLSNQQRLLPLSASHASLHRRDTNAISSEAYREYNSITYDDQTEEFSPTISVQETSMFEQNCDQRGHAMNYSSSFSQQFGYKSCTPGLDRSLHTKRKDEKTGLCCYDGVTRCRVSHATSTSSAASIMAAVYMNSRNPDGYLPSQNRYSSRISAHSLPQRIHSTYVTPQQQIYPNDLSAPGNYCSNPLAL